MNDTQIKTRHGLILQGALAEALREAGYAFAQDHQYDETCEIPDFLIPDGASPKIMIETHQTDARNSFQMKTLRAFTAVTESKARYGNKLVCLNVLFGDPENELPASNVRAMCGIFDLNIIPRNDVDDSGSVMELEATSLKLAADDEKTTEQAIDEVIAQEPRAISGLARLLRIQLPGSRSNRALFPLWDMERSRAKKLGEPPKAGGATYYKRMMLRALFLGDRDFTELAFKQEPDQCSKSVREQLVTTGLGKLFEEIDGDHIVLDPQFAEFVRTPDAPRLRQLCKKVLNETPEMHWFFEDIRDVNRRLLMAERFLDIIDTGQMTVSEAILSNLINDDFLGVIHRRCWFADMAARYLGVSHNMMNNQLRDLNADPQKLGNPFNQITYKSSRFMSNPDTHSHYANGVQIAFEAIKEGLSANIADSVEVLASRLLEFRLDGAIKLRKLDPLSLLAFGAAKNVGLNVERCRIPSIVSDLARSHATGRFEAFTITDNNLNKTLIANFVSVHDNNGDHKSKEWGARRLATLYRMIKGKIQESEYQDAIFVLDGEWLDKDVARLYRSGWNHVVRLEALEEKLRDIYKIPVIEPEIEIPDIELPLAAESDDDLDYHEG
jgi:hypothetical protein